MYKYFRIVFKVNHMHLRLQDLDFFLGEIMELDLTIMLLDLMVLYHTISLLQ